MERKSIVIDPVVLIETATGISLRYAVIDCKSANRAKEIAFFLYSEGWSRAMLERVLYALEITIA